MHWNIYLLFVVTWATIAPAAIRLAVTIDDLPTAGTLPPKVSWVEVTKQILQVLKKHKVPEVYGFVNASKIKSDISGAQVLQLWQEAGYPLGNHTYSHADLDLVTLEQFKHEIDVNESHISKFSKVQFGKYFRYPGLHEGKTSEVRAEIRKYLKAKNYTVAHVSVDFGDWSWNEAYARCKLKGDVVSTQELERSYLKSATERLQRSENIGKILFKKSMSHILLLHFGAFTAEMLDQLLERYKKMGVEFISLSKASRDEIYQLDPGCTGHGSSEFTEQVLRSRRLSSKELGLSPYEGPGALPLEKICQ